LKSKTCRWFAKPTSLRIIAKVKYHLGDEVMKVFQANDVYQEAS
jgi:hypothetical protein